MKIQLKSTLAGPGGSYGPGVHDLPEPFARELIAGGYAVAVEEKAKTPEPEVVSVPQKIETAAVEPEEAAVIEKPKARRPGRKT